MKKRRLKKKYRIIFRLILIIVLFFLVLNYFFNSHFQKTIQNKVLSYTPYSVYPIEVGGILVHTDLIKENTLSRPGTIRKIKYIVIHETDNTSKTATAASHAKFLKENNESSTSWHYTVDEKEIYHHIPDNEIAFHAGEKTGNQYGVGIELCVNEGSDFDKTMDNAAKLVAYLLKEYDLDISDIKTHHDFSGKDCPHHILEEGRMKDFKKMVKSYL